jgi:serine protease Do
MLWTGLGVLATVVLLAPLASGQKVRTPSGEPTVRELEMLQEKLGKELARVERMLAEKLTGIEQRLPRELEEKLAAVEDHTRAVEEMVQLSQKEWEVNERKFESLTAALEQAKALVEKAPLEREWISVIADGDTGWLGVSIQEVTAEKAKELKLPAERGVLLDEVDSDSPAGKAGLKAGDVITEFGGQRVEGTAQFRRFVRETPPGRVVQLTVWRDGKAMQVSVTVGDMAETRTRIRSEVSKALPRDFSFSFTPKFNLPEVRTFAFTARPLLGIRTEDLEGQLGAYFGAPESEGVLVTHVNTGSAAEKAGLKAGDVIVKVDGGRVRKTIDLRQQMLGGRAKKTISVTVLRKGVETTLNVEVEQQPSARTRVTHRINL